MAEKRPDFRLNFDGVSLERGTLRLGAKWYSLTNISSVSAFTTTAYPWARRLRIVAYVIGTILFLMLAAFMIGSCSDMRQYSKNVTGPRYAEARSGFYSGLTTGWICPAVFIGLGVGLSMIPYRENKRHHIQIASAGGETHRIDFPDEISFSQFCVDLTAAMTAAGSPLNVDARQVHVHNHSRAFSR